MEIPFTQYLRPDGRAVDIYFNASDAVYAKAKALIDVGYRFEAEVLTTGEVSITVFDVEEEEDIAIQICRNGPGIERFVEILVQEATDIMEASRCKAKP